MMFSRALQKQLSPGDCTGLAGEKLAPNRSVSDPLLGCSDRFFPESTELAGDLSPANYALRIRVQGLRFRVSGDMQDSLILPV
jgi:hypothetical protein